jgi:6-phosphofructokinase
LELSQASEIGQKVIDIRNGWTGLTNLNPSAMNDSAYVRELTRENTRTIDRTGGTILHTSRTNKFFLTCGPVVG